MHSSPAAGTAVPIPLQPVVQAPVPVPAQHPPASPQLRNTLPGTDPRGTKRAREEGDTDDREPSSEPVVKQARVEPAPLPENPKQALFEAIDAGDTAKFRSLLTQFPSLRDATDSQAMGETPLCRAARKGKIDIVNLLIELGAPVDARACNGATPLMFAAQAGQLEVIDQLCLSGADLEAVNPSIECARAMFFAAGAGQLDACKRLASRNANLTAKNGQGDTCLILAASAGRTAVVNWLLDQGVAIDEPNNSGATALMRAGIMGHLEVAQLLASRNANLTTKDVRGDTCLILAARAGHTAVVNWLLDQGVAIDEPDISGATALMCACEMGHLEVAQLLASRNANLTAKGWFRGTCLSWAASEGHAAVVNWLLDQGVAIDELDNSGATALMFACERGHLEVVQLLASRNANLTAKDQFGDTCLKWAASQGRTAVVHWLLANGASPDDPDHSQHTPLYYAVQEKHWHIVSLLLEYDVNLLLNSDDGTILGDAIARGAARDGHYQVLLQLFGKDLNKYRSFDYSVTAVQKSAIRDLASIFEASLQEEGLFPVDWLSDAKKSDRREFSLGCASDSGRRDLLARKNTLLSHVINEFLEIGLGNEGLTLLSVALSSEGKQMYIAQQQNMVLFTLTSLKNSSQLGKVFSGKHLSAEQEAHINAVLAHKLDAMILACQESLPLQQADSAVYFKKLCQQYLDIQGNFRADAFKKALCKQFGFYQINADRMSVLALQAWTVARGRSLDLPSLVTAEQAAKLGGQQITDSWLDELKRQLVRSSNDPNAAPGFREGFERLTGAIQKLEQSEQQRRPTQQLPIPQAAQQMQQQQQQQLPELQGRLHALYADLIFNQWRQINAVFGVTLPE